MINFYSENDFELQDKELYENWLKKVIASEGKKTGEISFIFCNDEYLLEINKKYLDHDTYTDIISFDNTLGKILQGDIFISTDRVAENAKTFDVNFDEELKRVMVHGILHFAGYKDKTEEEKSLMRQREEEKMKMFHVEQ
ncbi:rRNA maturation RNase YbeY [Salinimicrobium marinum]|uniref:rRNA maturation RNase YbeY n=1 Tax=Salinimicrobium marinum TaxID=680283 RepID=UPI00167552B2|nr:rRNA maturation RNase YbeY [Salinimicrobium marinum]